MAKMSFRDRIRQSAKDAENSNKGVSFMTLPSDVEFFKPEKGTREFSIVPFTFSLKNQEGVPVGEVWYRMQALFHYRVGPENKTIICPKTIGKRCPICEHRSILISQGHDPKDDEVKACNPKKRDLFNIIDYDDDDKLKIWNVSYFCFGELLDTEIRDSELGSLAERFAETEEGAILRVRFVEASQGGGVKFKKADRIDFKPRKPLPQKVLDQVVALDTALKILSYDEIRNLFLDLEAPDSSDDQEDDRTPEPETPPEAPKTAPEPPKEPEPSKPSPEPKKAPEKVNVTVSAGVCPHGGTFGVDCDSESMAKFCDACDSWAECRDAVDANKLK